ncbi:hypothetical protein FRC08_011280 [Ceratobasidium sp. 394]|nr:hypothetical protein FRC08_011280 [Ceratobasidium sp. 394]
MCRWFAYISDSEYCLLEDVLIRPKHSIVKQVQSHYLPKLFHHTDKEHDKEEREDIAERNLYYNGDGTGVAFYSTVASEFGEANCPLPQLYKTMIPPTNDTNFLSLCHNSSALTVFAHVRMATSEVQLFNSHPFAFGRHIFMHNGSISSFSKIRRDLCAKMSAKAYGNIRGSTDSEHLAAMYHTHLGEDWEAEYSLEDMKRALERAIGDVLALQRQLPDATVPLAASSLNLCTTDGGKLLAFRFRNSDEDEQPPSLYMSTKAGVTLNRKYVGHPEFGKDYKAEEGASGLIGEDALPPEAHGNHVVVSSEPTTYDLDDWDLIPKNKAVLVDFVRGCNHIRIEDINVP